MSDELGEFLDAAWHAASVAGEFIRDNWQRPKRVGYKGAIDLVTTVDRESERKIVELLRQRFPSHSILAEEETNLRVGTSAYRWIIDPLDGTTNFAHGYPHFCVSIALERDDEVILALVYDPLRQECFRAAKNQGATLNGEPIATSATNELDKALLATGFPYDQRDHADFYLSYFQAFMLRSQGIRRNGSAALDRCYVACGRLDGFWELKLKPWDTAAAALIVSEAGGKLSDFSGQPYSIWGSETLASNGSIHNEMIGIMEPLTSGPMTHNNPR
jgi:myo-inositol-1(or 4)-monophosphatase